MKAKLIHWFRRYFPAEVAATLGALIGGLFVNFFFHNAVLTAIGGTVGEFIFYYGTMLVIELRKHTTLTFFSFMRTIRNLLFEFGPAEFLDSFLIRPFSLYIFPQLLHNIALGLIVGKFVADIIFYIPTIIAYELRVKFGKD